eukprot:715650-Hanusia_phi.AAC.1
MTASPISHTAFHLLPNCLWVCSVSTCTALRAPEISSQDTEAEVRTAAAFKVAGFCSKVSVDVALNQIMPCIRDLVVDQSQHVRGVVSTPLHSPTSRRSPSPVLLPLHRQTLP